MAKTTTHEAITDLMVEGFEKLDDHLLDRRPPKITWLKGFNDREDQVKIEYLKKLASTMNHAAKLISVERDKLVKLMVVKEQQLEKMASQVAANNQMLQSEVTRMNEQKQGFHAEVSRLNKRIKELDSQLKESEPEVD